MQERSHHWQSVAFRFILDGTIVWFSFIAGIGLRFQTFPFRKVVDYAPGIWFASVVLPVVFYIAGFYSNRGGESERAVESDLVGRLRWLMVGLSTVVAAALVAGSIDFSSRIGRGVMLIAFAILATGVGLHHLFFFRLAINRWRRVACLVTSPEDEAAAALLQHFWGDRCQSIGLVLEKEYRSTSHLPIFGRFNQSLEWSDARPAELILVRDQHLASSALGAGLRQLRYQGVKVVSLADACEDAYHAVPLGLVTDSWLFRASSQAGLFYIKKLKRLFDVTVALSLLVLLFPVLLVGMLMVRLSSEGPIIFRQIRAGRLEKPFVVFKLRTMRVETAPSGGKWCEDSDPRIFSAGKWLRKFRIDEIPQLYNILRGEMSFVGPRPEQSNLIEELDRKIPFYRERLLIQPGLTGWAQVRYPYGATVEDAARKLEYDLYYMKHMSLFLDFFILIETSKIILMGGVPKGGDLAYSEFRNQLTAYEVGEKASI
ncbi:MAG: exopolysaccharide biosynthesis polyprenyl glycosylphosphotransferase [Verrucomicrobiae bacterium]|nr:exopolysaccharide biosynthesis polyprenyl glycosylphosphotransferase [Verrucomicrobiae bacterium]